MTALTFQSPVVSYSVAASGALLIYDILCTLDLEITYVWSAPWSLGTVLFFLNRYLPFIDTYLSFGLMISSHTPETCISRAKVVSWLIVIGVSVSEIILMIRTYAIWERKRSILILLCCVTLFTCIPSMVIIQIEVASLRYISPNPTTTPGCFLRHASNIIIVAYILLVCSETIIVTLTMIKASQHLRCSRSSWVLHLYRDGLLFYIYLLTISLANVLIPILAPARYTNLLATPQRVLHSILCNRVIFLILRQHTAPTHSQKPSTLISSVLVLSSDSEYDIGAGRGWGASMSTASCDDTDESGQHTEVSLMYESKRSEIY